MLWGKQFQIKKLILYDSVKVIYGFKGHLWNILRNEKKNTPQVEIQISNQCFQSSKDWYKFCSYQTFLSNKKKNVHLCVCITVKLSYWLSCSVPIKYLLIYTLQINDLITSFFSCTFQNTYCKISSPTSFLAGQKCLKIIFLNILGKNQ